MGRGEGTEREGRNGEGKGREGKGREGKGREGKGREGKGREGKGREGKGREGKGREGKGREGKGREGKGREGRTYHVVHPTATQSSIRVAEDSTSGAGGVRREEGGRGGSDGRQGCRDTPTTKAMVRHLLV